MCEPTEINYLDGEVVWVKLGSCWWPGEVVGHDKLPPDVMPSFRKPPIAVVKFFNEDTYEYVKNTNAIFKYNCSRKHEFIKKGLDMYRTKHGPMEKFPEDVIRAETATDGDSEILTRDEYQEEKKEKINYSDLFGDTPKKPLKGKGGKYQDSLKGTPSQMRRGYRGSSNYRAHILVQGSVQPTERSDDPLPAATCSNDTSPAPATSLSPSTSPAPAMTPSTPSSIPGLYTCHACPFTTTRLNVMILHNKTHSITFMPYTPSPVRKKPAPKQTPKSTPKVSLASTSKSTKPRKRLQKNILISDSKALTAFPKRAAEEDTEISSKRSKKDEEIKNTLLADWDDGEDSLPETPSMTTADSPDTLVSKEANESSITEETIEVLVDTDSLKHIQNAETSLPVESQIPANRDCCFEFCEDEDFAGAVRKLTRVKKSIKRKVDIEPDHSEPDDVAKEVAELLDRTTVPELPTAPEPIKVQENFPDVTKAKTPDKLNLSEKLKSPDKAPDECPQQKIIFKTKTFFRSRHSRSQDAIEKYVAEQLNSAERMDVTDASDINGAEVEAALSPDSRDLPPDHTNIRVPPKIQLKKLKAESQFKEQIFIGTLKEQANTLSNTASNKVSGDKESPKVVIQENIECSFDAPEKQEIETNNIFAVKPLQEVFEKAIDQQEIENLDKTVTNVDITENSLNTSGETDIGLSVAAQDISECDVNTTETIETTVTAGEDITNCLIDTVENSCVSLSTAPQDITECCKDAVKTKETNFTTISQDMTEPSVNAAEPSETELTTLGPDILESSNKNENGSVHCNITDDTTEVCDNLEDTTERTVTQVDQDVAECIVHTTENTETDINILEQHVTKNICSTEDAIKTELTADKHDASDTFVNSPVNIEHTIADTDLVNTLTADNEMVLQKPFASDGAFMSESTLSAVDALLSVSRDNDRVTKHIGHDPPDEIFEDEVRCDNVHFLDSLNRNGANTNPGVNVISSDVIFAGNNVIAEKAVTNIVSKEGYVSSLSSDNLNMNMAPVVLNDHEVNKPLTLETTSIGNGVTSSVNSSILLDNTPTESDLQIAETLLNLPSTAIKINPADFTHQEKKLDVSVIANCQPDIVVGNCFDNAIDSGNNSAIPKVINFLNKDSGNIQAEIELEKSENLNAAQSLVQMSETVELSVTNSEESTTIEAANVATEIDKKTCFEKKSKEAEDNTIEQKMAILMDTATADSTTIKSNKFETTSSKLLQMLEEPCAPKVKKPLVKIISPKPTIINFDVNNSTSFSGTSPQSPKQKIIIRRTTQNKNMISNFETAQDKIVLSRSTKSNANDSSVPTYTIQASSENTESNTIYMQQKVRKLCKSPPKLQKIKPQNTLLMAPKPSAQQSSEDAMFDINSMPIVLSDELLTPESIEKMPIVMSDGNVIGNPQKVPQPKPVAVNNEKLMLPNTSNKPELKTLLMNPITEKSATPNILSKSSKLRAAKPMLVFDKATGKQKIIMTKPEPAAKEIRPVPKSPVLGTPAAKGEKFIIVPAPNAARTGRAQKIVIDPQTGKTHVLVAKGPEGRTATKPVAAKLLPTASDAGSSGTVMIITNAQGGQSRIVLTPEHEKLLFPNKAQTVAQVKSVPQRHTITNSVTSIKSQVVVSSVGQASMPKAQSRIVTKQKNTIITSKGQLILQGRRIASVVPTTRPQIMPEIRPTVNNRVVPAEPTNVVRTIRQTTPNEPLIFLQQKSGAVMQLTAAQFEHLQRTGQIVQKTPVQTQSVAKDAKPILQKIITHAKNETIAPVIQKQRIRASRPVAESPGPAKRPRTHDIVSNTAPVLVAAPALVPLTSPAPPLVATNAPTVAPSVTNQYPDLDNFEELLPSTAIARQMDPPAPPEAPATSLGDGQLLAVPGENFGGPAGSFYLCVEESGTLTPIDNRPLVLENNQLVPMADDPSRQLILVGGDGQALAAEPTPELVPQPERRDILAAALANTDVFRPDAPRDEVPDFRDLNASVSVHCRVSETSTTLHQPIMSPIEVPSKRDSEATVASSLEDGLAVIGVTQNHTVPTSLELPITVTDPRIAPKTTDPLSSTNYGTSLLPSPRSELIYSAVEDTVTCSAPISMPLLTEEDDGVGKSMPILTDEITERAASSVESTIGSPSSVDVRESEPEEGGGWSRRLLTPGSDSSETSAEIPIQPALQLSVNDLVHNGHRDS